MNSTRDPGVTVFPDTEAWEHPVFDLALLQQIGKVIAEAHTG